MTQKARVLFNPVAGKRSAAAWMPHVLAKLRERFAECEAEPTHGPGSAAQQAASAAREGATHILVCGGDGTLAEALQGVLGREVALGILPLGTGNVVAHDLGLPMDPVQAAHLLLHGREELVPVGTAEFGQERRYFLASAGVGLHAELMKVPKRAGAGRAQYYAQGLRLLATRQSPRFLVKVVMCDGGQQEFRAEELLVSRVSSYGGLLRRWKPGMTLRDRGLVVTVAETSGVFGTSLFLAHAVAGWNTESLPGFQTLAVESVECVALDGDAAVQVDGTPMGTLPARFGSMADAVRLMMPA